tara:strand:- start:5661 stop:5843 length:183 start_codon:yes stop_codon:yes gene_type:complete
MKKISISFNFTEEQYAEVEDEAKTIDMSAGEMLTKVMKFLVKDMLETRSSRINNNEESPE